MQAEKHEVPQLESILIIVYYKNTTCGFTMQREGLCSLHLYDWFALSSTSHQKPQQSTMAGWSLNKADQINYPQSPVICHNWFHQLRSCHLLLSLAITSVNFTTTLATLLTTDLVIWPISAPVLPLLCFFNSSYDRIYHCNNNKLWLMNFSPDLNDLLCYIQLTREM